MSANNWPADYIQQQKEIVINTTIEEIRSLAEQYANPYQMIYFIVGDANTQMDHLQQLGFGQPVLLNGE